MRTRSLALGSRWALATIVVVVLALLTARSTSRYPGQPVVFFAFVASFVAMAALAIPKPRLYGYTFLAAFLFLGFCLKAMALFGLGIALVEPTGSFSGTGQAWDRALLPAIVAAVGIVLVRVAHLTWGMRSRAFAETHVTVPAWYAQHRVIVIAGSLVAMVVLAVFNLLTATYQVGIVPRLVLPLHLDVPVAWLLVSGLGLWAASLAAWEISVERGKAGRALLIPLVEALATVTTLSRASFLFRIVPYVLVGAEEPQLFSRGLTRRWALLYAIAVPVGFALTLAAVSVMRLALYPYAPVTAASPSAPAENIAAISVTGQTNSAADNTAIRLDPRVGWVTYEMKTLIVGRWIGMEGIMSVSSYQHLGRALLLEGLKERPRAGESGIYQQISGSTYHTSGEFIFLTTPGPVAILYYSGSLPFVFFGMVILATLLLVAELATGRLLANPFVTAAIGLFLANAITQVQTPYALFVGFVEAAGGVLVLWAVAHADTLFHAQNRKGKVRT